MSNTPRPAIAFDRRWKNRRDFKVKPGTAFDPTHFSVDIVHERAARPFVEQQHYSASYPAARIALGLFRKAGPASATELVGACVISVPMNQNVVPHYLGIDPDSGAEIGRFVLTPEVGFNGESWFLARALRLLRRERPAIRGLVSYADPLPRCDILGRITKSQHVGTIYAASNASYCGTSKSRTLILAPDGSVVSERAISKLRNDERGRDYAEHMLIEHGAPERMKGESAASWIQRALSQPGFRRIKHPGNHVYLFALDRSLRRTLPTNPYPKKQLDHEPATA